MPVGNLAKIQRPPSSQRVHHGRYGTAIPSVLGFTWTRFNPSGTQPSRQLRCVVNSESTQRKERCDPLYGAPGVGGGGHTIAQNRNTLTMERRTEVVNRTFFFFIFSLIFPTREKKRKTNVARASALTAEIFGPKVGDPGMEDGRRPFTGVVSVAVSLSPRNYCLSRGDLFYDCARPASPGL